MCATVARSIGDTHYILVVTVILSPDDSRVQHVFFFAQKCATALSVFDAVFAGASWTQKPSRWFPRPTDAPHSVAQPGRLNVGWSR
jgi:hypothetical protein